jgi:hypothetical protein
LIFRNAKSVNVMRKAAIAPLLVMVIASGCGKAAVQQVQQNNNAPAPVAPGRPPLNFQPVPLVPNNNPNQRTPNITAPP